MKKICVQCGKKIEGLKSKYCSHECYKAFQQAQYKLANPDTLKGRNTGTTGAMSELRVAIDLMSKGYDVFRALSPHCPCDLAVLIDSKLLRIEVRTAQVSTSGKKYKSEKARDKFDHYAWVYPCEIMYEPSLPSITQ